MKGLVRVGVFTVCFLFPVLATLTWVNAAADRTSAEAGFSAPAVSTDIAIARAADEQYCTADLKRTLRRVVKSCGLLQGSGRAGRGCQPVDARAIATLSDTDFNDLFLPMKARGGIIQFEQGEADMDAASKELLLKVFSEQRGASYFFIVARASPEGSVQSNRTLSEKRAKALLSHLQASLDDPDLDSEVGLLWLGEEYAQLDESFCNWTRSGDAETCRPEDINRSAFVAWIDCRL